jgi:hypothetical protein
MITRQERRRGAREQAWNRLKKYPHPGTRGDRRAHLKGEAKRIYATMPRRVP